MNSQIQRNSAFELIRIIAILFIVTGHIFHHAFRGELSIHDYCTPFFATGVNLFILISGYHNIKLKWKSLLTITTTAIFIYSITTIIYTLCTGNIVAPGYVVRILAPMSRGGYWFVSCYMMLMLLSPALNLILEKSNKKRYYLFVIVLLYLNCVSGWIMNNPINSTGYTLLHMILIYTLGDMTRRYNLINKEGQKGYLVYITATAAIFIINEMIPLIPYNSTYLNIKLYSYNNPLVIIASIALFCFIAKYKFHSNGINNIAKYAFALYLVQDCYPFGGYLYNRLYEHAQSANTLLCIIVYLCVLFLLTYILEKTRRFILNKPIDKLSDFLEKKINISQE